MFPSNFEYIYVITTSKMMLNGFMRQCKKCLEWRFGEDVLLKCKKCMRLYSEQDEQLIRADLYKFVEFYRFISRHAKVPFVPLIVMNKLHELVEFVSKMNPKAKKIALHKHTPMMSLINLVIKTCRMKLPRNNPYKHAQPLIDSILYLSPDVLLQFGYEGCLWVNEDETSCTADHTRIICSEHLLILRTVNDTLQNYLIDEIISIILTYIFHGYDQIYKVS